MMSLAAPIAEPCCVLRRGLCFPVVPCSIARSPVPADNRLWKIHLAETRSSEQKMSPPLNGNCFIALR